MQRWLGAIVFIAAVVTMGRMSRYDFTDWDDRYTIAQNPQFNPPTLGTLGHYWTHGQYGLFMPGTYTVWTVLAKLAWIDVPDDRGYRLNPWVFHSASILFHALAAVIVYALLRRMKLPDVAACLGALLFAVHPVQVESVGWMSGMKDVLCGLFSLIALWQYAASVQAESKRAFWMHFTLATLSFAWALLCKPAAVVVPGIAVLLDWLVLRRSLKIALRTTALWWPMALAWMLVARYAQPTYGIIGAPLSLRPLVALDAIAFYLGKLCWPIGLAVDYGRTPIVAQDRGWLWWTWLVPAAIAALLAWRPKRELIAAALVFVIAIAPVLGFVPFLFQYYTTVADHYLYLAMLGPALALAWAVARWDRRWMLTACSTVIALLAILSVRQASTWRNDQTLFAHTMRVNPDSFLAHHNLASALVREGDLVAGTPESLEKFSQARDLYSRAIQIRRKVNHGTDDYCNAHQNLAAALERLGLWEAALAERQTALSITLSLPPGAQVDPGGQAQSIARDLMVLQRWPEALEYLDQSLKANPGNTTAQADRRRVLEMMGK